MWCDGNMVDTQICPTTPHSFCILNGLTIVHTGYTKFLTIFCILPGKLIFFFVIILTIRCFGCCCCWHKHFTTVCQVYSFIRFDRINHNDDEDDDDIKMIQILLLLICDSMQECMYVWIEKKWMNESNMNRWRSIIGNGWIL